MFSVLKLINYILSLSSVPRTSDSSSKTSLNWFCRSEPYSSVIRQKYESLNRAYQGVTNVGFLKNLACSVFLLPPFWDSSFCLIINQFIFREEISVIKIDSNITGNINLYLVKQQKTLETCETSLFQFQLKR